MPYEQEVQSRIQDLAVNLGLENDSDPDEALDKLDAAGQAVDVLVGWYQSQRA